MFDFIRKSFLWRALDEGLLARIGRHADFHLKTIQDLAVFDQLKDANGLTIAEIGGGDSRLLRALSANNTCFNIEKFQGADGGPKKEIVIPNVTNIHAFVGEHSGKIPAAAFDVVFSVSVVEHLPDDNLVAFLEEGVAILKPAGLWLHAVDLYLEDEPSDYWRRRYDLYLKWLDHPKLESVGDVMRGPLKFSASMASNPDNVMYSWARINPALNSLRQNAQSVSLLVAQRKIA